MKLFIGILLYSYFILNYALAEQCLLPQKSINLMSPGKGQVHVFIKINFNKINSKKQVVYLDSCGEKSILNFSPFNFSNNLYFNTGVNLNFMFYDNGKLIGEKG